ncbi:MAG: hypothetical protein RIS09_199 [Actinomycetota bacterium]|jgi:short-subunit dehydrogenase
MSMNVVITGATAGIGKAYVEMFASLGANISLISRNAERMQAQVTHLKSRFPGQEFSYEVCDLATEEGISKLETYLTTHTVDVLVNNAGFATNQKFHETDMAAETVALNVMVNAVMRATYAVLPQMMERGGEIVVVASVAGFLPGGTYSAIKAWNVSFVEGLSRQLKRTNVRISALCPGFTRTEFHERAGISTTAIPNWLWLDANKVVRTGWEDHLKGRVISIPGWQYKTLLSLTRILPRRTVANISGSLRKKQ